MLEVTGLSLELEGSPIFERVAFRLDAGEFGVILGPSGCGKTSLFRTLAGLVSPSDGAIHWNGRPVPSLSGLAAWMPQKDLLLPWATLEENVRLPGRVSGRDGPAERRRASVLLERFGLGGYERALPRQISGGMRQRCALVRTILTDKPIVLLDEPLSSLDALTRWDLQGELLRLQREFGRTVLMVTHDVEEALLLADTVFLLRGRPARMEEILRLDLPKPRNADWEEIVRQRSHLLGILKGGICDAA